MDKGKKVAWFATLLLITVCGKPNLSSVAREVVAAVNDISVNLNAMLNGGYTVGDAKKCQREPHQEFGLKLQTKAIVNIYIAPDTFSLYTEEHAATDFGEPTWYKVDLNERTVTNFSRNWKYDWVAGAKIPLPGLENEKFITIPDYTKVNKKLSVSNPFAIPRERLGVGLGFGANLFNDKSVMLSVPQSRTVNCAGALNAYYEALIRTEYDFSN